MQLFRKRSSRPRGTVQCAAALALCLAALPAFAVELTESQIAGKAVYMGRCIACHEPPSPIGLTPDDLARNEAALPADETESTPSRGPSLVGLVGRRAGSLSGYEYSDAMKQADVVWTTDSLRQFLLAPAAFVPRTKMHFIGMKRAGEMEPLLDYLQAVTAPKS